MALNLNFMMKIVILLKFHSLHQPISNNFKYLSESHQKYSTRSLISFNNTYFSEFWPLLLIFFYNYLKKFLFQLKNFLMEFLGGFVVVQLLSHVQLFANLPWPSPSPGAQTHVHWVSNAIQTSHPLSSPSPPAFNIPQHQDLFQWIDSSYQVAKVLELQLQHQAFQWNSGLISFRIDWFDLLAVQRTLKSLPQHHSSKASILLCSAFFMVLLACPYMTTGKTIALTIQTFVGKVMSLLFSMLSRLVIAFLPKSKHLLISISIFPGGLVVGILGFHFHDPGSVTGQETDCQAIWHSQKSKKNFFKGAKHLLLLCWLFQNLWLWITTNCGKFLKRWEYHTTPPASWEICMQVKKQQLELDMEQQTGSKSGKKYIKAVYCHLLV